MGSMFGRSSFCSLPFFFYVASATTAWTQIPVTLDSTPPGMPIHVDGLDVVAPAQMSWGAGSTHAIAAQSPPSNPTAPGVRLVFSGWSDGGAQAHNVTIGAVPTTFSATFKQQYRVELRSYPDQAGTQSPSSRYYD